MGDLLIGQKADRVLTFIAGLAHIYVRRRLAPNGFDDEELEIGWTYLNAVTTEKLGTVSGLDLSVIGELDAWENEWLPITEIVLRTNFPAVHKVVFLNLKQTEGVHVVVSVKTMLDRLDVVSKPEEDGGHPQGAAARARLVKRGLTDEVVGQARGLLAKVGALPEGASLVDGPDPDALVEAEEKMWNWYLEWSTIARKRIHDRKSLRALGFLRVMRRADGREVDVVVDDEDLEEVVAAPQPTPTPPTPTPATPTPEPEPTPTL